VTPDPGTFFFTSAPDPRPEEKRRILPESIPALRIHGHLWCAALFSKFTLFLSLPTKRLVGMFFKRLKSGVNHYLESKKEHKKGCFAQLVGRSRLGSDQASTSET